MQKNKEYKTFSYPYLSEDTDHYKHSTFTINIQALSNDGRICFKVDYDLKNEELMELIFSEKIKVSCELKCSTLGFVRYYTFDKHTNQIEIVLRPQDVEDTVEFTCYLIANEDILFNNQDLSNEWLDIKPLILKNNVLGESDLRIVTVKHDKKALSIFGFISKSEMDENDAPIMDIETQKILFYMPNILFKQFKRIQARNEFAVIETLLVPAVATILTKMAYSEQFVEDYCGKEWYKVLRKKYEDVFDGAEPEDGGFEPFKAAQTLFPGMIRNTFTFVQKNGGK